MLNGDFSFPGAPGGGFPIYNPFSTRQVNGTWTRDPLPGNIVPKNLFDPVAVKFLAIGIWRSPISRGRPAGPGRPTTCSSTIPAAACTAIAGTKSSTTSSPRTRRSISAIRRITTRPEWRSLRQAGIQCQPRNRADRRHQRRDQLHLHHFARDVQRISRGTIAAPRPIPCAARRLVKTHLGIPGSARKHFRTSTSDTALPRWDTIAKSVRTGSCKTTSPGSPASTASRSATN